MRPLGSGGPKIITDRKPVQLATIAGVDDEWRPVPEIAAKVHGYSAETVKNNLIMLREEMLIEMRYGPRGRAEYRLPMTGPPNAKSL